MIKLPLFATILILALGGCATERKSSGVGSGMAPVPTSLRSEFNTVDENASFFGPFLAATQAQQDAEYRKSAEFYLQALKADPNSRYVADRAFFQLLYGGRTEKAAELASQLAAQDVSKDDDLVQLMHVLGAYKNEDWPLVRERLVRYGNAGFGFIVTPLLRAWSYGAEGNVEAAEAALVPLFEDKRLKSIAEEHTAYIFDHLEQYETAKERYVALTQADPPVSLQPAIAYAHMLYRTGEKREAIQFLGGQVTRFRNHNFLLREGSLITNGGRPTQLAATPRGAAGMVFFRLATEFAQGKSAQAAILYARIAAYLVPEVSDVHFLLGRLLAEDGNNDAAAAAYNNVPLDSPVRRLADARRIDVLQAGGRGELAEKLIRNMLGKTPNDMGMLVGLGDLLQRREAYEDSIKYYDRAIATIKKPKQSDWYVYFARAISYESLGNWLQTERNLQQALKINPEQPGVLNYLGYSWIDRGMHIAKAKGMIERAAASRPNDGAITDSLGWVHFLTGDYSAAVTALEKAVRLEPDDITINDHLGDAYWRVGRTIEARFQWQHAIDSGAKGAERAAILEKLEAGLPELS